MDGSQVAEMQVSAVPGGRLDEAWRAVYPILKPAVERSEGRTNMALTYEALADGRDELWIAHQGGQVYYAFIITVTAYNTGLRGFTVKFGGGRLTPWMLPVLDAAMVAGARKAGCAKIEWIGRQGWARVAKRYGYRAPNVILEKDVRA